jgi:hypothetical protein
MDMERLAIIRTPPATPHLPTYVPTPHSHRTPHHTLLLRHLHDEWWDFSLSKYYFCLPCVAA